MVKLSGRSTEVGFGASGTAKGPVARVDDADDTGMEREEFPTGEFNDNLFTPKSVLETPGVELVKDRDAAGQNPEASGFSVCNAAVALVFAVPFEMAKHGVSLSETTVVYVLV